MKVQESGARARIIMATPLPLSENEISVAIFAAKGQAFWTLTEAAEHLGVSVEAFEVDVLYTGGELVYGRLGDLVVVQTTEGEAYQLKMTEGLLRYGNWALAAWAVHHAGQEGFYGGPLGALSAFWYGIEHAKLGRNLPNPAPRLWEVLDTAFWFFDESRRAEKDRPTAPETRALVNWAHGLKKPW